MFCSATNSIKAKERPESSKMWSLFIWNQTCTSCKTKLRRRLTEMVRYYDVDFFSSISVKRWTNDVDEWRLMATVEDLVPLRHKTLFSVSGIPPTQLISSKIRFLCTEIYHLIHSGLAFGCSRSEFSNQMINDAGLDGSSRLTVSLAWHQIPTNVPDLFASNLESLH